MQDHKILRLFQLEVGLLVALSAVAIMYRNYEFFYGSYMYINPDPNEASFVSSHQLDWPIVLFGGGILLFFNALARIIKARRSGKYD